MKTNMERIEKNKFQLEIEVPAEELERAVQKAYLKIRPKLNIPGFRKGKAPRNVVEMFIGRDVLVSEALDELVPETYIKALEQNDIEPIDQPEIDFVQAEMGKDLIYKAVVEVKPEVKLGEYKGLELTKEVKEITDEDVNKELEYLRQFGAKNVSIENGVLENGLIAFIDYEGFIDGEPFEGGKGTNYTLTIGSNTFIPGFEEQLIGAKAGEEREVKVTFPEDYKNEKLAGKDAVFKVLVKDVMERKLPELNDEFAKTMADFETLDEFKAELRHKLVEREERFAEDRVRLQALDKLLETIEVEVPEKLIERTINQRISDLEQRLKADGLDLQTYLNIMKKTEEDLKKEYRDESEKRVKVQLTLETIAKKEGIKVEQEDIDKEIKRMAEAYNTNEDVVKSVLANEDAKKTIMDDILRDKALDFVIQHAKIETV